MFSILLFLKFIAPGVIMGRSQGGTWRPNSGLPYFLVQKNLIISIFGICGSGILGILASLFKTPGSAHGYHSILIFEQSHCVNVRVKYPYSILNGTKGSHLCIKQVL